MQKSRRAFLQRRAVEKATTSGSNHLYKVSLSLVFVLWGLVFLFSLWISRGHSYKDVSEELPAGILNWDEAKIRQDKNSDATDKHTKITDPCQPFEALCTSDVNSELLSVEANTKTIAPDVNTNHAPPFGQQHEVKSTGSASKTENDAQKADHFSHSVPLGLEEFKSRAFSSKVKTGTGSPGNVVHRLEPGGEEYNYASASKGAKVLASNKEAKGASNILSRDKDKYLRNPCSVEEKFVIIELSEETLVDTIEIANLEHYSSNLRDFELLGSSVYPTDVWVSLGNFTAANVKHLQRFVLQEPKWVRYLRLNIQKHYGSEFYCTLSVVEVYGVDAVERMLEDLIYAQDNPFVSGEGTNDKRPVSSLPNHTGGEDMHQNTNNEMNSNLEVGSSTMNDETVNNNVPDPVEEIRQQVGRLPGDTALKILMQKVRSLDINLFVLERYLEELNSRYTNVFKEYNKDVGEKDLLLQKIRADIRSVLDRQEVIAKDADNLISWKSFVSLQLDNLVRDNSILRSEVEKVQENQAALENKGIVVFMICLVFLLLASVRLLLDIAMSVYKILSFDRTAKSGKFCPGSCSWLFLLCSCSIIILILSL
ncbi:Galactose-binding domain-like [Quillaja saponaria]|uniref:Galactose-binding domain-like n=1 Tax=Quillaja saponaria TaxID=32244 RepID=A0AAD7QJ96_QUISA|nr:Galactose-binding domain-like [Quillaja saponaria]